MPDHFPPRATRLSAALVACYGIAASDLTKALLPAGTTVQLETDVSDTDRYDRLLRYVWFEYDPDEPKFTSMVGLANTEAGELDRLNQLLMTHGMAQSSSYPPDVAYLDIFVSDQQTARDDGIGLWGSCSVFGVPAEGETDAPVQADALVESNPTAGGYCDPSYLSVCIPTYSQIADLDCAEVDDSRFEVVPPDPHEFDRIATASAGRINQTLHEGAW